MANNEFEKLRDSFEKLAMNDSAIEYEYENNKAMGFGFRCGFLGMLHMDIVKERLEREYNIQTIFTIPNVVSIVRMKNFKHDAVKS
jgi:GTP-binding protein LepA